MTVQVDKSRNGEARHGELFTFEVVKPLLDKLLAGILPKNLAKTFFSEANKTSETKKEEKNACQTCKKKFQDRENSQNSHNQSPQDVGFGKLHIEV